MSKTSIPWSDYTWNPTRGCSPVSAGCKHCYAERLAARNLPGHRSPTTGEAFAIIKNGRPHWTGKVELIESKLTEPLHWKKPRRIFVNSMSDLWHENLPGGVQAAVYAVMAYCQWHDFQVLTKRPEIRLAYSGLEDDVRAWLQCLLKQYGPPRHAKPFRWPLPNVWEGVSVEDQATADDRIPKLLQTPAAVRFVSYEPALGPVDFTQILYRPDATKRLSALDHKGWSALDWVIVGGESGPGARPFDIDWARDTIRQYKAAGVAVFVKQLGSKPFSGESLHKAIHHRTTDGKLYLKFKDSKGGNWEDWPEDLRIREFPR